MAWMLSDNERVESDVDPPVPGHSLHLFTGHIWPVKRCWSIIYLAPHMWPGKHRHLTDDEEEVEVREAERVITIEEDRRLWTNNIFLLLQILNHLFRCCWHIVTFGWLAHFSVYFWQRLPSFQWIQIFLGWVAVKCQIVKWTFKSGDCLLIKCKMPKKLWCLWKAPSPVGWDQKIVGFFSHKNNMSKTEVAPWCYKWTDGLDWMGWMAGWGEI